MGKILKQFRYYGDSKEPNYKQNYPVDLTRKHLTSGLAFILQDNESASIVSLGIQSVPGLKFYLNEAVDPIILGSSGIYQLDLINNYEINKLSFDESSLKNLVDTPSNTAYLIIDIIYEVEG